MAENVLETRILLRYGTYSQWMNSSTILRLGEAAICSFPNAHSIELSDSHPDYTPPAIGIKIGDGYHRFNQLPWVQAVAADVYSWAKQATKPEYNANEINGLQTYIEQHIPGGGGSGGGRGGVLPANQATTTLGGGPGNVVNATSITVPMSVVPINFNTASSTWSLDEKGNWHLSSIGTNGEMIEERNNFACITSVIVDTQGITTQVNDIYYFDEDGKMYTGWLKDANGVTYFFEMSGAEIGKQAHGWRNIGGIYYYFSQDGSLFKGGLTPDGYMVDAEGKWVNN